MNTLYGGTLSAELNGISSRIGMNWKAGWRRCLPLGKRPGMGEVRP